MGIRDGPFCDRRPVVRSQPNASLRIDLIYRHTDAAHRPYRDQAWDDEGSAPLPSLLVRGEGRGRERAGVVTAAVAIGGEADDASPVSGSG